MAANTTTHDAPPRIALPGTVLGVGLGGFVDGILLHQLLQWHHMLSSTHSPDTVPGLRMNTVWDGLFHAFTWLAVLVGLGLLYSRVTSARGRMWRSRVLWVGYSSAGACSTSWRAWSTTSCSA